VYEPDPPGKWPEPPLLLASPSGVSPLPPIEKQSGRGWLSLSSWTQSSAPEIQIKTGEKEPHEILRTVSSHGFAWIYETSLLEYS